MSESFFGHNLVIPDAQLLEHPANSPLLSLESEQSKKHISQKFLINQLLTPVMEEIVSNILLDNLPLPKIITTYRSCLSQLSLYTKALIKSKDYSKTISRIAPPFYSEHHSGLAIDIESLTDETEKVLKKNGFIASKINIPGLINKPWHWRHERLFIQHQEYNTFDNKKFSLIPTIDGIKLNRSLHLSEIYEFLRYDKQKDYSLNTITENILIDFGINGIENIDEQIFNTNLLISLQPGSTSLVIGRIQEALKSLGFSLDITGTFNQQLDSAVSNFCNDMGYFYPSYIPPRLGLEILNHASTALTHSPYQFNKIFQQYTDCGEDITKFSHLRRINTTRISSIQEAISRDTLYVVDNISKAVSQKNESESGKYENTDRYLITPSAELKTHLAQKGFTVIHSNNLRRMLYEMGLLAGKIKSSANIAITGSCGKTTSKEFLFDLIKDYGYTSKTKGSANSLWAVSISAINAPLKTKYHIYECGLGASGSSLKDMSRLIRPDIAVITCVKEAHMEGYNGINELRERKLDIAEHMKNNSILIVDGDDPELISAAKKRFQKRFRILFYGSDKSCDAWMALENQTNKKFPVYINGKINIVESTIVGYHNRKAIMLGMLIGISLGISSKELKNKIINLSLPKGRGNIIGISGKTTILYDSHYNANPASMVEDLKVFNNLVADNNITNNIIAVIGDMAELGIQSSLLHQQIIQKINSFKFDKIFIVGEYFSTFSDQFNSEVHLANDANSLISLLANEVTSSSYVFLKGSNSNNFSAVSRFLRNFIYKQQQHLNLA